MLVNKSMTSASVLQNYLTKHQAAADLGKTTRTLDRWHTERRGPRRTLIGRSVYYSRKSLSDWLQQQEEQVEVAK